MLWFGSNMEATLDRWKQKDLSPARSKCSSELKDDRPNKEVAMVMGQGTRCWKIELTS